MWTYTILKGFVRKKKKKNHWLFNPFGVEAYTSNELDQSVFDSQKCTKTASILFPTMIMQIYDFPNSDTGSLFFTSSLTLVTYCLFVSYNSKSYEMKFYFVSLCISLLVLFSIFSYSFMSFYKMFISHFKKHVVSLWLNLVLYVFWILSDVWFAKTLSIQSVLSSACLLIPLLCRSF